MTGLIHVRDALRATTTGSGATVGDVMSSPLTLPATHPVATAVTAMRTAHAQLAIVTDDTGQMIGIAALEDLLEELIGDFDDETDTHHATTT